MPQPPNERTRPSPPRLRFIHYWSKLQSLLAEVIHTNLTLMNQEGQQEIAPSLITECCSNLGLKSCSAFDIAKVIDRGRVVDRCEHGLYYAAFKVVTDPEETYQVLFMGPFLVGERETVKTYQAFCLSLGLDAEVYCDQIRELRLYSEEGIQQTCDLVRALIESWEDRRYSIPEIPVPPATRVN